ncbi:MAG: ISL3 family transposase [Bacteroidota bacterium]
MDQQEFFRFLLGLTENWQIVEVRVNKETSEIDIFIEYTSSQGQCPHTKELCRIYDLRENRRWRHLDIMQYKTYINCRIPRVINDDKQISTIEVPWSDYSERYTYLFEEAVIKMLKMCKNQTKTAVYFGVSYDIVSRIMIQAADRGIERRVIEAPPSAVGLDEKSFLKGFDFITVLTDIDNSRVLNVERGRTKKAAEQVLTKTFAAEQLKQVKVVVCDMCEAYLSAGREQLPAATQVADRFHLIQLLNIALDKTRRQELKQEKELLVNAKFALLKRPENLTDKQKITFKAIDQANLRTARVWRAKENFRELFNQPDKAHASISLSTWLQDVKTTTLFHLNRVAETFNKHFAPVCNALWNNASNAIAERINGGIQELKAISRGFRNYENFRAAILFHYGKLNISRSQNIL